MLTIEQYRILWQLLAALACDYDVINVAYPNTAMAVNDVMKFVKKILEEN